MTVAASQQQRHVFAIRHGVPDVAAGLCYGNTDLALVPGANDAVLTQHAALLAQARAENWPVFSSPLRRCASLAAQIRPDFQTDPRLREWDFGDWEMCAWDTVPRAELDEWAALGATLGRPLAAALHFDTGMSRMGFPAARAGVSRER